MRQRRRSTRVPTAVLVMMALSGCGLIFSQGPPEGHEEMSYFTCTEGNTGPILDLVWGGLNVVGALIILSDPDSYDAAGASAGVGLAWAGLSVATANLGFKKSRECRAAKRALANRGSGGIAAYGRPAGPQTAGGRRGPSVTDTVTVGDAFHVRATVYRTDGTAVANNEFGWSSSNEAVATVNRAGFVIARAEGEVIISAEIGKVAATVRLLITQARRGLAPRPGVLEQ